MTGRDVVLDDQTLVIRAQEGDVAAFESLLRRYQGPMYRLAARVLDDAGHAEDAVQEAFVSAWRRLPAFRADAAFSSWLYRIVVNRCLNIARAGRRRPIVPIDDVERLVASGSGSSPEQAAEVDGQMETLRRALVTLPAEQRVCWVLREADGLSYGEIAEIVGTTPDAVRGRIHRARRALGEALRPWR